MSDYKRIPLRGKYGKGKFATVSPEDYEWAKQFKWRCDHDGYAAAHRADGVLNARMHRLILERKLGRVLKPWPVEVTDHINQDRLDNRRENLRAADFSLNRLNTKGNKNSTSRFRGVSWCTRPPKWKVGFKYRGKEIHLGYFVDEVEAAKAYDKAVRRQLGPDAPTNF